MTRFFAYATAQHGLFHHEQLGLGEPVARLKLAYPHSLVIPRYLACSDPTCRYLHRSAVLVKGAKNHHPEGDVYEIDEAMLARLDALAAVLGPYTRVEEELSDGSRAFTYGQVPPNAVIHAAEGVADLVEHYPRDERPRLKNCCAADLDHYGAHDVIRTLDALPYGEAKLRNMLRSFRPGGNLHILRATAALTPYPILLAAHVTHAISEYRDDREGLVVRLGELLDEFPPQFLPEP